MQRIHVSPARTLQLRAIALWGVRGYRDRIAEACDYTADYVGRMLNERVRLTEEAAARIEGYLAECESAVIHETHAA